MNQPLHTSKNRRSNHRTRITLAVLLAASLLLSSCSMIDSVIDLIPDAQDTRAEFESFENETERPSAINDGVTDRERNFSVSAAATRAQGENGQEPLSTMEIAAKAQPTVVAISISGVRTTNFGPMDFEGAGSGVIVSSDGYIVTNNHVVSGAETIDVVLANGKTYPAEVVGTAQANDLAVIKVNETGLPAAVIGNSDDLIVGELAVAVGNPLGDLQGTVTAGIISSLGRTLMIEEEGSLIELRNLIQTDAAINSGNSGGGLFNSYGELIGINVAKASSNSAGNATVEGLGFAIPTNTATPIINSLVNNGVVTGMPALNITGSSISEEMAASYEGSLVPGVWVREIAPNSCVIPAGIEVGDVIVAFAGEEVSTVSMLNLIKNRYRAGDTVEIRYYRDGEYYDTTVVLDEMAQ